MVLVASAYLFQVLCSVMPTFDRVRCSCNRFRRTFEMIPPFYWKDDGTVTFTASWPSSVSNTRVFKKASPKTWGIKSFILG